MEEGIAQYDIGDSEYFISDAAICIRDENGALGSMPVRINIDGPACGWGSCDLLELKKRALKRR